MSFRQHSAFTGLYTENVAGSTPRRYGIGHPETHDNAGTYPCHKVRQVFPFDEYDVDCPAIDALEVTFTDDILTADAANGQVLADRALLLPHPDYVQISVSMSLETSGGSTTCLPENDSTDCPPTSDGTVEFLVSHGTGVFPWGVTETIVEDGVRSYSDHTAETELAGFGAPEFSGGLLRRAADGLTYEGQPDNLGVDTLFPWAEIVANPSIVFGIASSELHDIGLVGAGVSITPWYRLDQVVSANLMCVL